MTQIDPELLKGKVAVITGAGRGIGRAIALAYARAGAALACSARGEADIAQSAALIREAGGRAIAHAADVADYATMQALFQRAELQLDAACLKAGRPRRSAG